MANNVQTAAEWARVATEQQALADSANAKEVEILNQLKPLASKAEALEQRISRIEQLTSRANSAVARGETLSPTAQAVLAESNADIAALRSELSSTQSALAPLRVAQGQIATQRVEATRAANEAKAQQSKAESGPPDASSTPQPAGPSADANGEGNNTDIATTVAQNEDGAAEGGNTAANALNEPPAVPNEDGAAEGGNTAANPQNEDGAAEGGNTAGNVQPPPPPPAARQAEPPKPDPPKDWRVRISLAKDSDYLYKAKPNPGILYPLVDTDGVVFPYTPTIQLTYNAKYDTNAPTHSNYNIHAYQGSSVEAISISGEFTAQSIYEANYLLAVIHFFRSVTKMFYGQDANRGVPPPLLYLSGYGNYQFDNHPMVLQSFTYTLPPDVDYVDAYSKDTGEPGITQNGISLSAFTVTGREIGKFAALKDGASRLLTGKTKLATGGKAVPNKFISNGNMVDDVTRVPTKITIALSLLPIVTRNAISNKFSLKEYATGKLLRGSKNQGTGGGIW